MDSSESIELPLSGRGRGRGKGVPLLPAGMHNGFAWAHQLVAADSVKYRMHSNHAARIHSFASAISC